MDFNIFDELRREGTMISQAPILFIVAVGILGVAVYASLHFIFKERFKVQEARISTRDDRISVMQNQLDELQKRNERSSVGASDYRRNIVTTNPDSWVLKFGVYWYEKRDPFCAKCNLPLTQALSATNVLHCNGCGSDFHLNYGSKRYPLDEAVKAIQAGTV
jgi:hypothetical protein